MNRTELIDLSRPWPHLVHTKIFRFFSAPLAKILLIPKLNQTYRKATEINTSENFFRRFLKVLKTTYTVDKDDLKKIPTQGSLIIISNHPFGGLDGMILGAIFNDIRPDIKILANEVLTFVPELRAFIIPIERTSDKMKVIKNTKSICKAIKWLQNGNSLITFPAGGVSRFHLSDMKISEYKWNPYLATLITHSQATVLPVFVSGKNSILFHLAGLIHPIASSLLMPYELANKSFKNIKVYIGNPIPWQNLCHYKQKNDIIQCLYHQTISLPLMAN